MAYQRSPTEAESALLLTACLALPIDCGALHVSQLCVRERGHGLSKVSYKG